MTICKINADSALKTVETILRGDKSASPQMRAMMELLVVVIGLLLAKLGRNSSNSSTPPSKDPHWSRGSKRKTKGDKLKPGGQSGHEGNTIVKVDNPDKIELLEIDRRTIPSGKYMDVGFDSRQVIEIEISKKVAEYRAEILEDAAGKRFVARFPDGVTRPVQYGNLIKAQAAYMSQQQLIPYDRATTLPTNVAFQSAPTRSSTLTRKHSPNLRYLNESARVKRNRRF